MYEEKQTVEIVKSYAYDSIQNILILVKFNVTKKRLGKIIYVIDLNENNTQIYSGKLQNSELKGRLKTGLFMFVDGHMYYNNKCIKLRFDLLR